MEELDQQIDYGQLAYMHCEELDAKLNLYNDKTNFDGFTYNINSRTNLGYGNSLNIGRVKAKGKLIIILYVTHDCSYFELWTNYKKIASSYSNILFITLPKINESYLLEIKGDKNIFSAQLCAMGENIEFYSSWYADVEDNIGLICANNIITVQNFNTQTKKDIAIATKACFTKKQGDVANLLFIDRDSNVFLATFDEELNLISSNIIGNSSKFGNNIISMDITYFGNKLILAVNNSNNVKIYNIINNIIDIGYEVKVPKNVQKIAFVKQNDLPILMLNTDSNVIYLKTFVNQEEIIETLKIELGVEFE